MKKRTGFTVEQHTEAGIVLKRVRDDLTRLQIRILNAYSVAGRGPVASKAVGLVAKIDALRSALEDAGFREHGDAFSIRVYYPGTQLNGADDTGSARS